MFRQKDIKKITLYRFRKFVNLSEVYQKNVRIKVCLLLPLLFQKKFINMYLNVQHTIILIDGDKLAKLLYKHSELVCVWKAVII
jgi:hypothetical protein